MTEKEFDRKIGNSLRDYREPPPEALFTRIERTLAETGAADTLPHRRRPLPHAYRYGIAAAVLLVAMLTVLRLARPTLPSDEVAQEQLLLRPNGSIRHSDRPAAPVAVPEQKSAPEATRGNAPAHDDVPAIQGIPAAEKDDAPTTTLPVPEARPVTEAAVSGESDATGTDRRPGRGRRRPPRTAYDRRTPSGAGASVPVRERMVAAGDFKAGRRGRQLSGTVYAGNFGTLNGHAVTHNPDMAAAAGMLVKQTSDGGMTLQSGLHEENGRPLRVPKGPVSEEVRLQHRMPLNVGLSLSIPLNDRLALTTGLNYSYLYSSSDQSLSSGTVHVTRELHYVGLPVGLAYTFYRTGAFGLYIQGGGMMEKGVAWRETQRFADTGDSGRESTVRDIRGIQFSVNAAAGISYDFSRHVGLYVEPGVTYYFAQKDQPASYRTVHPTSFSLKVGVRFGI